MCDSNHFVNQIKMERCSQRRARPHRAFASELPMKNKRENGENRCEPQIPKKWSVRFFFLEMSEMPNVLEQNGGPERDTGE